MEEFPFHDKAETGEIAKTYEDGRCEELVELAGVLSRAQ